jgi:hypothetical protein
MNIFSFPLRQLRWALVCLAVISCVCAARAEESLHGEALLVWGTNEPRSPDPKHVPVDRFLARKLAGPHSPYKWKYYYEVPTRQPFDVRVGETQKKIRMSDRCTIDIKNLGKTRVEVRLYGEGKPVFINSEPLTDDWPLVYAGDAGNETGWFVVIRKVKPGAAKDDKALANEKSPTK